MLISLVPYKKIKKTAYKKSFSNVELNKAIKLKFVNFEEKPFHSFYY